MKTFTSLIFALIIFSISSKAQFTISPDVNTEVCHSQNYTFTVTIPGTNATVSGTGGASVITNASSTSSTFTFVGKFNDVNQKQIFTVAYKDAGGANQSYPFAFKKVKSLFSDACSLIPPSTITAPQCQITNIPYSFTALQWFTNFENPKYCFGSISTYEYLLPAGWKLNGATSTGSSWLPSGSSVTFTSNANTGGIVQVRAINSGCATSIFKGSISTISISRPNPVFTISPSTVSMTCGTVFTKTFTVSTTGTLVCPITYNWNLGSASNGWLYNGIAAPASFSTTTNSITLTSANPNTLPSNVTVTPVLNGVNQPLLTSTLSFAPLPLYIVSGDNIVCTTSGNYFVPSLPAGATVHWQAVPNIVTINSPNATQTTITAGYNGGIISLIATITNQCGQVGQAYKYDIVVGSGVSSLVGRYYLNGEGQAHDLITYYGGINYIPSNSGFCSVFIDNPGLGSATWSLVSGNIGGWTQFTEGANHILLIFPPYGDPATFRLSNTNSCGTYDFDVLFAGQYFGYYRIAPNPTKDNLTISVDEVKLATQKIVKSSDQEIREIVILDKTGIVQAKQTYSKGTRQMNMNISNLKTGIYIVRIYNGKEWTALKLVKE